MDKLREYSEDIPEKSVLGIEPPEHFSDYGEIITLNNKLTILKPLEKYRHGEDGDMHSKEVYDIFAAYSDKIISELQERGIKNSSFEAPYGVSWRTIGINDNPKKISSYGKYWTIENELYKEKFKIDVAQYKKTVTSKYDQILALREYLPEHPRVLYIGSGRDFSLQETFPDMIHLDPAYAINPAPAEHILLSSADFFDEIQVRQLAEHKGPFDMCIFSNFMFIPFYDASLFEHLKLVMNDHAIVYNSHNVPFTDVDLEKENLRDSLRKENILEEQKSERTEGELWDLMLAHRISSNFEKFGFSTITPDDFPTLAQVYKL